MFKPSEKSVNMSHLQTEVGPFTANELVEALGENHMGESDKVTMEWHFEDEDGNIATLYDYKENAQSYPTAQIRWSVGGFDEDTAIRFHEWLKEKVKNSVTCDSFDSCWENIPAGC
jgi:hypothetical protein